MAPPKTTLWSAEPHTRAKHVILRSYLQAWFPILSTWHERVVYYDGFAGPGRYSAGEEGSPLIALSAAREHRANLSSEIVFIFVERDPARAAHLQSEISQLDLPANYVSHVRQEDFAKALTDTLDYLDEHHLAIAPTFAFVDPFGVKGLPFSLIRRLLQRPRCETLITFMNSAIRRFVDELSPHIDELVGRDGSAKALATLSPADRVTAARRLYADSLRDVARFVRFFAMRDAAATPIYDLFFASNHPLGHYKPRRGPGAGSRGALPGADR